MSVTSRVPALNIHSSMQRSAGVKLVMVRCAAGLAWLRTACSVAGAGIAAQPLARASGTKAWRTGIRVSIGVRGRRGTVRAPRAPRHGHGAVTGKR